MGLKPDAVVVLTVAAEEATVLVVVEAATVLVVEAATVLVELA